jgi:hypothetical protein
MKEKPILRSTIELGFLAEKKTQIKLIELGFITLEPILDGGNIDMISLKNNIFKRLQIKSAYYAKKEDRFYFNAARAQNQQYDYTNIDYFIFYIFELDEFYLIPSNIIKSNNGFIRVYPHRKSVRAKDKISFEKFRNNFSLLENNSQLKG